MRLTNEQIQNVVDGVPFDATHWDSQNDRYWKLDGEYMPMIYVNSRDCFVECNVSSDYFHNISDLREILELRQQLEQICQEEDEGVEE